MLSVGYGNGIHFRPLNGQLPSFDNTFLQNENFPNRIIRGVHFQQYFTTDKMIIQARVGNGDGCQLVYHQRTGGVSAAIVGYLPANLVFTSGDFWQFEIDFSTWNVNEILYFVITNPTSGEEWRSETVQVIAPISSTAANPSNMLKIEWYGIDAQFGCAYDGTIPLHGIAFVPFIRLEATLKKYEPKEEITVYGNQDEATKLYNKVSRTLEFRTDALPRFMLEKLVVASAHDAFFVNEVEFVREEVSEVTDHEGANTGEIKVVLTQVNVLGLNTHDIGFDCNGLMTTCKVTNLEELNVSANTSFTIPDEHGLDIITTWYNAGTDILIKFGTTVGGDEVGTVRPSAGDDNETLNVPQDLAKTGTATLYVTVSGTSVDVDIYVRTIKNRS